MDKIGIIGCGNMGEAILAQSIKKNPSARKNFVIYDKDDSKLMAVCRKFKVKKAQAVNDLTLKADILIIAVKPQDIDVVLEEISSCPKKNILLISIAAGVTTKYIEEKIGRKVRVVRVMPNLPAKIGFGVSAVSKGRFAGAKDFKIVTQIFARLGQTINIKDESLIDAVTAISGSGPAYVFFIFNAIFKSALELGIDKKSAQALIWQTFIGSTAMLKECDFDTEKLISNVASKGGTTEAALKIFHERSLDGIIRGAILAAKKKAACPLFTGEERNGKNRDYRRQRFI